MFSQDISDLASRVQQQYLKSPQGLLFFASKQLLLQAGEKEDIILQYLRQQGIHEYDSFEREKERLRENKLLRKRDEATMLNLGNEIDLWLCARLVMLAGFIVTCFFILYRKNKGDNTGSTTTEVGRKEKPVVGGPKAATKEEVVLAPVLIDLSLALILRADKVGLISKEGETLIFGDIAGWIENKQYFLCGSTRQVCEQESSLSLRENELDEGSERSAYIRMDFTGPKELADSKFFSLKKKLEKKELVFSVAAFGMLDEVGGIMDKGFKRS